MIPKGAVKMKDNMLIASKSYTNCGIGGRNRFYIDLHINDLENEDYKLNIPLITYFKKNFNKLLKRRGYHQNKCDFYLLTNELSQENYLRFEPHNGGSFNVYRKDAIQSGEKESNALERLFFDNVFRLELEFAEKHNIPYEIW